MGNVLEGAMLYTVAGKLFSELGKWVSFSDFYRNEIKAIYLYTTSNWG